ncbi:MAG TPA: M3 family oligoendopeptidase [Clostridiaceae bacterium]|jgi:M3 family oligoendopeptidase|nr:M3 family oligoendopeptidase [Clostridiaceae bacterium]
MKFSEMTYVRPDIEAVSKEIKEIIERVKNAQSAGEQLQAHKDYNELCKKVETMYTLAYIRHTINTEDEFYDKEKEFYDENLPLLQNLNFEFYKAFVASKFRKELEEKLGSLLFRNAELELKAFDPKIIPDLQEENKLVSEYVKLMASAQLDIDGKKVNLSQLRFYMESPDRNIRKEAFKKRTEFFSENGEKFDEIFDKLVKVRTAMAKKLGFEDFVELGYIRMRRNCYGPDDVAAFKEEVKKYMVPLSLRIQEKKKKMLGLEKITVIDQLLYFREGNPNPKGTPEEIFENGKKMYDELSKETSEFFRFMLENDLLDCLSRKGKAPGGYMTFIPDYKSPFIFANFNGTSGDIDVLTHEAGHALNGYLAKDIDIYEYASPTYEACEVHSMSMEFFTMPWMKLFFGDRTEEYKYMHLAEALIFIPYGCAVDEFQHVIYRNPDMTPQERKEAWRRIESEFQPYLDYEDDEYFGKGGRWQAQTHIYKTPFYYIDYCLAQTCALQFRNLMTEDYESAWKKYLDFSKKAGTMTFVDLLKTSGLRSPFEEGCVKEVCEGSEKALEKMNI